MRTARRALAAIFLLPTVAVLATVLLVRPAGGDGAIPEPTEESTGVGGPLAPEQAYAGLVEDLSPAAAFAMLRADVAADPELLPECHYFTHVIGEAAIRKYGTFAQAMRFNDDLCGSGYMHSLIVGELDDAADPATVIAGICDGLDGYCLHGVGHGLMFHARNDLPRALDYCATLPGDDAARCSEGAFMQNFEAEQHYATPYRYDADPLRLCREEKRFKTACYHYAGAWLARDWARAGANFAACDAAEPAFRWKCVGGMGAHVMATRLHAADAAIEACRAAPDETVRDWCMDGVAAYHLVNGNSLAATREWCAGQDADVRPACERAVEKRAAYWE